MGGINTSVACQTITTELVFAEGPEVGISVQGTTTVLTQGSGMSLKVETYGVSTVVAGPAGIVHFNYGVALPDGSRTGDFLRWNAATGEWEVRGEPLEFTQIVLTPTEAAALVKEGSLWYKASEKAVFVCVDDH